MKEVGFDKGSQLSFSPYLATTSHFNPTFEVSVETSVSLSAVVLDPKKHSAVTFKENFDLVINKQSNGVRLGDSSKDCPSSKFPRIFYEYNRELKLDIVGLLDTRVSESKGNCIIAKLGFQFPLQMEAIGFSSGIWVGWKDSIQVEIIQNYSQFLLVWVISNVTKYPVFISFVYGSPDRRKRRLLWKGLKATMSDVSVP
ncbi:hypothetical protein PVK06_030673 [Gossypium arboreum]|uniref:Uncharacterized protein n=1 Tax=Gossypium arboreum TaxID=29729 RepID=A0ABR0NS43_GOSAR|nr:hypothetical protein PVK06_030673 [Gossypium arboreum]